MVFSDDFRKKLNTILALAVTILAGLFVVIRFDIYYDLNDDVVIRDILSGVYSGTPETRNMQMLYPLSFILAVLYNIVPIIPWYGFMLGFIELFCLFLITKRSMEFCARISGKIIMSVTILAVWAGVFAYRFVFLQYTVTAGIMVGTALFRFLTNYSTDPDEVGFTQDTARVTKDDMHVGEFIRKNIINMLLLITAFLLRSEMALLMLPLIGIAFILKWAEEKPVFTRENFEKFGSVLLIVVICCGFMWMVDSIAYSRDNWSDFRELFDARTEIYDFTGIPSYEENAAFYDSIDVSREEYDLMVSYNYGLSDQLDHEKFQAIADYADTLQDKNISPATRNKNAVWSYVHGYLQKEYMPYVAISLTLLALILIAALAQKQFQIIWKIVLFAVLRAMPWLYLYYRGRVVDRVTIPLFMVELMLLAAMLLMEFGIVVEKQNGYRTELRRMRILSKWEERRENLVRIFPVASLFITGVIALFFIPQGYQKTVKEYENRKAADSMISEISDYMKEHAERYYLIDVYSSTSMELAQSDEVVNISRMVYGDVTTDFGNYDMLGGWISKSPLYKDKLSYFSRKMTPKESLSEEELVLYPDLSQYDEAVLEQLRSESYLGYQMLEDPEHYQLMIRSGREKEWLINYYKSQNIEVSLEKVDEIQNEAVKESMEIYKVCILGTTSLEQE